MVRVEPAGLHEVALFIKVFVRHFPHLNKPFNQIAPKSYLGCMLEKLDKPKKSSQHHQQPSLSSDSSSSDSSPSSSSSSSDLSDSDDECSGSSISSSRAWKRPRHKSKTKWRHSRRRQSRSKKTKTLIQPIPPIEYDGTADARTYHWFVTEGTRTTLPLEKSKRNIEPLYFLII